MEKDAKNVCATKSRDFDNDFAVVLFQDFSLEMRSLECMRNIIIELAVHVSSEKQKLLNN